MSFDAIFSGSPANSPFPSAANTVTSGIDTNAGAEWVNVGKGWQPLTDSFAKNVQLGLAAEAANFVVVAPVSGLYRVSAYEISTNATSGTLPRVQVSFTEADTAGAISDQVVVAVSGTIAAANTVNEGSTIINAAAGTNITISTATYASLGYNLKTRIEYLG